MQGRTNAKRRGAELDPPNRFERIHIEEDADAHRDEEDGRLRILPTEVYLDDSKTIVTENDSPDVWFRYSLNPYRGCEHGCTYCYARPTHEQLGWSAGLDFERRILAKPRAPRLLAEFLRRPAYRCEPIVLSGVTDPYQPVERRLGITRRCLELMLECGQPVELVSKSGLILRDLDLFAEMARRRLVAAAVAVTTLDRALQRSMEPRAASPEKRLEVIQKLSEAGVPVRLLLAPWIPGLTDPEIPAILEAAARAGATAASYVLLRLPYAVKEVFFDWLDRTRPNKRPLIESRIREIRGGKLNDPSFATRMKGAGPWAEEYHRLFELFSKRFGLDRPASRLDVEQFRPPRDPTGQLTLF